MKHEVSPVSLMGLEEFAGSEMKQVKHILIPFQIFRLNLV